ncbi:sensor histidine kinase [Halorussus halophilus]|uniref:sensor histidine kinase n=1 Tax=Halorussus halophilus TaxID=2650975 RepID=UPI0017882BA9|nr:HAMP domain-containing sensor histidine kinase [Halorussus halophilus]
MTLGGGLLVVSASYLFVGGDFSWTALVGASIPIGISLLVVALGLWLRTTELPSALLDVVFLWSLAGGIVMGLLTGWVALLQSVQGQSMLQPASIVLTKISVGVLGGGLLGVYHSHLRYRTEQLAEQRNRLDEFAGIVSHDLRNPLNVAQGHLNLARETGDDDHFEAIEGAHDRMERLVEEVLALSRGGDTVADREPVDIGQVAREAWGTVETGAMDLRVETDRTVVADGRRLRALFENLFRNSVEHGATNETVEDGATTAPSGGEVVVTVSDSRLVVEDDGPGIPPEEREIIFEGGYSTEPDGTGFGLSIVRRIAVAHDWRIYVDESQAGGARFEFVGFDE